MSDHDLTMTVMRRTEIGQSPYGSAVLQGQPGSIGRSLKSNHALVLEGNGVSRNHAEITYKNGVYSIVDRSSAGTKLNKERLTKGAEKALSHGDRLSIADYLIQVSITVAKRETVPGAQPGPEPITPQPSAESTPPVLPDEESKTPLPVLADETDDVLRALLAGLGLEDQLAQIATEEREAFAHLIGVLLSESMSGIVSLLAAREEFRRSYSTGRSRIQNTGNIMYLGADIRTVLKFMLFEQYDESLTPTGMLGEVLEVLQLHEMGLIATFEQTLKSVVETFDPNTLEEEMDSLGKSFINVAGLGRWGQYKEAYDKRRASLKEQQNPFREIVAQSYEHALLDLRNRVRS
ncbi:MAG: type VI secretion system-associated FHA domain protein [Pseudomonadota bacterium]